MKSAFMNDICRAFVIWGIVEQRAFSFCVFKKLAGCQENPSFWAFSAVFCMTVLSFVDKAYVYMSGGGWFCQGRLLCRCIWTTSDLLHLISDMCGFCVPVNTRTTLRRNTETKRSWSTVTAARKSTGRNIKRGTKRRGERKRFVKG